MESDQEKVRDFGFLSFVGISYRGVFPYEETFPRKLKFRLV